MATGLLAGGRQPVAVGFLAPPADKMAHFAVYGLVGLLLWWALDRRRVWLAAAAALALGAADEWQQGFIPGREPGWGDWLADAAGVAVVLALASRYGRRDSSAA